MINKRRLIKTALIILCIAVLMTIGLYVYGSKADESFPEFSSYNKKAEGTKALFLLTEKMGYNVSRYERPARFLPEKVTLVAIKPDTETFAGSLELKYLKEWLNRGNTLVLIDDASNVKKLKLELMGVEYLGDVSTDLRASSYDVAGGKLYFLETADRYTNKGLKELEPAVEFIGIIDLAGNKSVAFNEYYHGIGARGTTIIDLLGVNGMLVVVQILLALIIYMYYLSRRFGKPAAVFETVKRRENENLFALSGIYMKSKAYSLVLETYMQFFKSQIARYLGYVHVPEYEELYKAISGNSFLSGRNVGGIMDSCRNYIERDKKDGTKLLQLIKALETIRKEIG